MKIARVIFIIFIMTCWTFISSGWAQKNNQDITKYKKILVLAQVQQADIKKNFENAVVSALSDKGYSATPSYNTITADDIANTARIVAKADSLGVDALLVFTLINIESSVINTPQVTANVGIPVQIGFFSVFLGSSIPLGGGSTVEKTVNVKAGLYTDRNSTEPSWSLDLTGSLADGNDALIYNFTRKTVKALFKQKIL